MKSRFSLFLTSCLFLLSITGFYSDPEYSVLFKYDLGNKDLHSLKLSEKLKEISGLAVTKDDRLFTHDDNVSIVYQLDINTGKIIKQFTVGKNAIYADFEDITFAKDNFYLVTSNGYLYEFKEGGDNAAVSYTRYETGLTSSYNIEGLCYDEETNTLLLACKEYPGHGYMDVRTVYSFSLETYTLDKKPRFIINLEELKNRFNIDKFKPSGIARHPSTGNFFVLSAHSKSIVELSAEGKILNATKIPKKVHNQPEGITFLHDRTLLISDEGDRRGSLTIYEAKWF